MIKGIVEDKTATNLAKAKAYAREEVRKSELLTKSKTEGLTAFEKAELAAIYASRVLNSDVFTPSKQY